MTKKFRISPAEREVLWVLSEAREDYLPSLINTIYDSFSALSHREMLMMAENAIRNLYRQGFIQLCIETQNQGRRSLDPLPVDDAKKSLAIGRLLKWDEEKTCWGWDFDHGGHNITIVVLTEMGAEVLRS